MIKIQCIDTLIEIDSSGSKLISTILDDNYDDEIIPVPYHSTLVHHSLDENLDIGQKETEEISKILECANFLDTHSFDKICRYIANKIKKQQNNQFIDLILSHPDKPWDWQIISSNPNITMQFIIDNPDKPWDWGTISRHPNITMQNILDHPDKPWDWGTISRHPNITMQFILDNPDKPWNWWYISQNPSITMQNIVDNPDKPWDWNGISGNPNITMQFILDNPNKPWNWRWISCNSFDWSNKVENLKQYNLSEDVEKYILSLKV
jgi:hypothetical protein